MLKHLLRNRIVVALLLVLFVIGVAVFVVVGLPFLTTESEASRGVVAERISDDIEPGAASDLRSFLIVGAESEVRFILDEELRGRPTTVIGRTNQVAGEILIDATTPANSVIGPIEINLRTLETDNGNRNRMIRSQILRSGEDAYEFTHFVPTAIEGLPETVTIGTPFTFKVTGDLKLVDTTRSVTFEVTVTPVSEDRIEGLGRTVVLRSDYGLQIPSVPNVANVTNEVTLEIQFVATRAEV
jgi:polyisoprenoid-binding protein YceI